MKRHPDVELIHSRSIHRGPIFELLHESVRLPSGLEQSLDVIDHAGAVCVAAVDSSGKLVLVKQYRHATGEWLEEIPAGRLESKDSDPLAAAKRELEEETGLRAGRWTRLREFFPAPGFCGELMTLCLAEDLEAVPGGGLAMDEDEELEVVRRSPAEVLSGDCRDAKTLLAAGLLLARC